jgi:predicted nucleic acid-binding protein
LPGLIIVDTSVWVAYFRGTDPLIQHALDGLIDDDRVAIVPPVRLELILGCRKAQRKLLMERIDALHHLHLTEQTWALAEELSLDMRGAGTTPGVVDVLIAAAAMQHETLIWTLDKDFIPLFRGKHVRAFSPPRE